MTVEQLYEQVELAAHEMERPVDDVLRELCALVGLEVQVAEGAA